MINYYNSKDYGPILQFLVINYLSHSSLGRSLISLSRAFTWWGASNEALEQGHECRQIHVGQILWGIYGVQSTCMQLDDQFLSVSKKNWKTPNSGYFHCDKPNQI